MQELAENIKRKKWVWWIAIMPIIWFLLSLIPVWIFDCSLKGLAYGLFGMTVISSLTIILVRQIRPLLIKKNELSEKLLSLFQDELENDREKEAEWRNTVEKYAKVLMEANLKNQDNAHELNKMQQEYNTHLADVVLEMFKSNNQINDQQTINQIVQQLINQNNG